MQCTAYHFHLRHTRIPREEEEDLIMTVNHRENPHMKGMFLCTLAWQDFWPKMSPIRA